MEEFGQFSRVYCLNLIKLDTSWVSVFQSSDILLRFEMQASLTQVVSKLQFKFRTEWGAGVNFGFDHKWILATPQPP